MKMLSIRWVVLALAVFVVGGWSEATASSDEAVTKFHPVQPVTRDKARTATPQGELRISQGQFFSFAMPPDWRVGEDGQFALTLIAPDSKAVTVMVGNAGLPPNYPPGQFAYDKLMALQPQNLELTRGRPAQPVAGFAQAYEFDVEYSVRGIPSRGIAKVSVAPAYDTATMAMTAALTAADQWDGYSTWLPQVAEQIAATNGAAFGMRGIMQQNLKNSTAFAETARQYREWSQHTWQQVTDARNASQDRKHTAFRENLGAVQIYANPFGTSQPKELPTTHKYYWIDRQDHIVGTDDPKANPNVGSTQEWRPMERVTR